MAKTEVKTNADNILLINFNIIMFSSRDICFDICCWSIVSERQSSAIISIQFLCLVFITYMAEQFFSMYLVVEKMTKNLIAL